jgi:RNA polymerase sigma-70 factor (ECF subfamily)
VTRRRRGESRTGLRCPWHYEFKVSGWKHNVGRPDGRAGKPTRDQPDVSASEPAATVERLEAEAFLSALIRGAPWAAEEAWNRYAPMVHDLLRRGLGPGADLDDLVQEVFLRLFRRAATLRDAMALRSFVFSIGARVMRWQLRRRMVRRWVGLSPTGELPDVAQPPVDADAREALRHLYALLEKLGPADRTIFVLRQSEELSLPEIASIVEMSLSTVKRRLGRVSARMARLVRADPLLSAYVSIEGLDAEVAAEGGVATEGEDGDG